MQQRQHQGRREREYFSLLASSSTLCSVRETYGPSCILLHLFSIVYVLSLCDGNGPFVLAYRAMHFACVHARTALCWITCCVFLFLPSFVLFLLPFSFLFFYYLRSNYHVWVCLCGCNSSNISSSSSTVLLLGTHSTTMTRKKLVHVRTRMNKREKEKREREWDQSIRQLMYYCIYITSTTMLKTRLLWEEKKKEMDKVWIAYGSSNITGMITFFSYCLFST